METFDFDSVNVFMQNKLKSHRKIGDDFFKNNFICEIGKFNTRINDHIDDLERTDKTPFDLLKNQWSRVAKKFKEPKKLQETTEKKDKKTQNGVIENKKKGLLVHSRYNAFVALLIIKYCRSGFNCECDFYEKPITASAINDLLKEDATKEYLEKINLKISLIDESADNTIKKEAIKKTFWALIILSFDKEISSLSVDQSLQRTYDDLYKVVRTQSQYKNHYFPIENYCPDQNRWNPSAIIHELARLILFGDEIWFPACDERTVAENYLFNEYHKKILVYGKGVGAVFEKTNREFEGLYVDLPIMKMEIQKEEKKDSTDEELYPLQRMFSNDILEDMSNRILLIEADAGKGKTTLLKNMFNHLIDRFRDSNGVSIKYFPIWIECSALLQGDFPVVLGENEITLKMLLRAAFEKSTNIDPQKLDVLLTLLILHKDKLALFIDGLDEIDSINIIQLIGKNSGNSDSPAFIIGSRPNVLKEKDEELWKKVKHYRIDGLNDDKTFKEYINRLFEQGICRENNNRTKQTFLDAVEEKENENDRYKEMIRTPLILVSVLQTYLQSGSLPSHEIQAHDDLVRLVFNRDIGRIATRQEAKIRNNDSALLEGLSIVLANFELNCGMDEAGLLKRYFHTDDHFVCAFEQYIINHNLKHVHANIKDTLIAYGVFLLSHWAYMRQNGDDVNLQWDGYLSWLFRAGACNNKMASGLQDMQECGLFDPHICKTRPQGRGKFILQSFLYYCNIIPENEKFQLNVLRKFFEIARAIDVDFEESWIALLFESVGLFQNNRIPSYECLFEEVCRRDVECLIKEIPDPQLFVKRFNSNIEYFFKPEYQAYCRSLGQDLHEMLPRFTQNCYSNPYDDLFSYAITSDDQRREESRLACVNICSRLNDESLTIRLMKQLFLELENMLKGHFITENLEFSCREYEGVLSILRGQRESYRSGLVVLDQKPKKRLKPEAFGCIMLAKNFEWGWEDLNVKSKQNRWNSCERKSAKTFIVEPDNGVYYTKGPFLMKRRRNEGIVIKSIIKNELNYEIPKEASGHPSDIQDHLNWANSIKVERGNKRYQSIEDAFLVDKKTEGLIACAKINTSRCKIPSDPYLSSIECSFYLSDKIESVEIPRSVKSICKSAFYGCRNLASISFEDGSQLVIIRDNTFAKCSRLKTIIIPDGVKKIGDSAFKECVDLTSIVFKKDGHLSQILPQAFFGCVKLSEITIPREVEMIGNWAFLGCSNMSSITFEDGCKLDSIGERAFGRSGLHSIIIPESITIIPELMLSECSKLTTITISNSVKKIKYRAFNHCTELTSIIFEGTKTQWALIEKDNNWDEDTGEYRIYCVDGPIEKCSENSSNAPL